MPHPRLNLAIARQRRSMEDPYASGNENRRRNRDRALREVMQMQERRNFMHNAHAGHRPHLGAMEGSGFPRPHRHRPNSAMRGFGQHPFLFADARDQLRRGLFNRLARPASPRRPAHFWRDYLRPIRFSNYQFFPRGYPPWPHSRPSPWESFEFDEDEDDDFTDNEQEYGLPSSCSWPNFAQANNRYIPPGHPHSPWYPDYDDGDDYEGDEDYGDDEFDDEDEDDYDYPSYYTEDSASWEGRRHCW